MEPIPIVLLKPI